MAIQEGFPKRRSAKKGVPILSFVLLLCFPPPLLRGEEGEIPPIDRKAFVAVVDRERVTLDQVLEIWGPAWYEAISAARAGEISPAACDHRLQREWMRAVDTAIRDEVFYQESIRQEEKMFQQHLDQIYRAQTRASGSNGESKSVLEQRLRRQYERMIERQVEEMIERQIRASGGIEALKRTILRRGLTWEEWRRRLIRKAMIYRFLYLTIEPLGQNQPEPRPTDIREFYQKNPDQFQLPGRVRFRHILFSSEARGGEDAAYQAAVSVYEAIRDGRISFEEAARKHSDDAVSREQGGLETEISPDPDREAWLSDVREAARGEKPGTLGPILMSPRGCHLVFLEKAEKGRILPFREAQSIIVQRMKADRWEKESQALYEELKKKTHIEILMPEFPSALSCASISSRAPGFPPLRRIGLEAVPPMERRGDPPPASLGDVSRKEGNFIPENEP